MTTPSHHLQLVRESAGLSQKYLAELAGMTPIAIHRYEQMVYANPSPTYIAALAESTGYSAAALRDIYYEARKERIATTCRLFKEFFASPAYDFNRLFAYDNGEHPYKRFRYYVLGGVGESLSDMAWCSLTCFHPGQLYRFEQVGVNIPKVQREFLESCGVSAKEIKELNAMIKEYQGG